MSRTLAAALCACVIALFPARAAACGCRPIPLYEQYATADQVFLGELVGTKDPLDPSSTFRVKAQWKGVSTSQVAVRDTAGMCGMRFDEGVGETYLVFASRGETGPCAGTRNVSQAEATLDFLGPAFGGVKLVWTIWGAFAVAFVLLVVGAASLLLRPRRLLLALAAIGAAGVASVFGISRTGLEQRLEASELLRLREFDTACEKAMQASPGPACADVPLRRPEQVKDGFYWATAGGPFVATIWTQLCVIDVRDGAARCSRETKYPSLDAIAVTPDGKTVVSAGRARLTAWTLEDNVFVPRKLAPSASGSKISDGAWCIALGFDDLGDVLTVAWANSEAYYKATEADTWGLQRWDVATGRMLNEWTQPGALAAAAVSPNGKLVAVARNSSTGSALAVHDALTGELRASEPREHFAVRPQLAFVGPMAIAHEGRSRHLELIQLAGDRLQRKWEHETQCSIRMVARSRDGILLTADGTQLLDLSTGEVRTDLGGWTAFGEVDRGAYLLRGEESEPHVRRCVRP